MDSRKFTIRPQRLEKPKANQQSKMALKSRAVAKRPMAHPLKITAWVLRIPKYATKRIETKK